MENINTFDDDLLGRKQIAINLTNIIKFKPDLKVLAIDSSWGTGKTTFANMWGDMINNQEEYSSEFEIMNFNAWENDYISDPLCSLLSELEKQIQSKNSAIKSIFEKGKDKIKPYARIGTEVFLKYITKGALDNVEWEKNLEDSLIDLSNKLGQVAMKEITISKNSRKVLKDDLKNFQKEINKKVVIFIDELDRCKPIFAVSLLETIKHIFNLDNYTFVIFLDKEQLSHSVKTLYGQEMDSDGYLRRFFDLEYQLPNDKTLKYIEYKNNEVTLKLKNIEYFKRLIQQIFQSENYSLRDVNKAYDYISILLPNIEYFSPNSNYIKSYILVASYLYAFFINLKIKHSNIYRNIKNLNYYPTEEYIEKNILTFELSSFDLKFNDYSDNRVKEILSPVIFLYLKLKYLIGNSSNYYFKNENEEEKYYVGVKDKDGKLFFESKVELMHFIDKGDIFKKLDFLDNFNS